MEQELHVAVSCHVGAGIKPWVLWENNQFSEPQNHISSPKCAILKYGLISQICSSDGHNLPTFCHVSKVVLNE